MKQVRKVLLCITVQNTEKLTERIKTGKIKKMRCCIKKHSVICTTMFLCKGLKQRPTYDFYVPGQLIQNRE